MRAGALQWRSIVPLKSRAAQNLYATTTGRSPFPSPSLVPQSLLEKRLPPRFGVRLSFRCQSPTRLDATVRRANERDTRYHAPTHIGDTRRRPVVAQSATFDRLVAFVECHRQKFSVHKFMITLSGKQQNDTLPLVDLRSFTDMSLTRRHKNNYSGLSSCNILISRKRETFFNLYLVYIVYKRAQIIRNVNT